ncbi:MAG: phosphoribosylamine--glycine ligase [Phycisphaerales bacterium]|nr:phosphoribosylamine--glycine ligase [Phycisphaerales bacterium]
MTQQSSPCPDSCRILLIGGGGREHALAWKLSQSPRCSALYATGITNGGIAQCAEPCPHDWNPLDTFPLVNWCEKEDIDLVVVGPEAPLSEGITDVLIKAGMAVFGPTKAAAMIEADKAFAKTLMKNAAVPTAEGKVLSSPNAARRWVLRGIDRELESAGLLVEGEALVEFVHSSDDRGIVPMPTLTPAVSKLLQTRDEPCVVKATGLAAGKGVIVCKTTAEAIDAIDSIMCTDSFGDAGKEVLIEEFLQGQEVSVLALVDGHTVWVLDPCQDHKQVGEGDTGPNTGGMGAYCPTPIMNKDMLEVVEQQVLLPVIDGLRRDEIEYRGVLYAGLMLTPAGPKVLEFNCRFGDPECQPLMSRLQGDLVEILWATATGNLSNVELSFSDDVACCVVMCSAGYPGAYEKDLPIEGIKDAEALDLGGKGRVRVFHAGTKHHDSGRLVTNGGRVLGVTAMASSLAEARELANAACDKIHFDGAFWRHDIGCRVEAASSTQA